MISEWHKTIKIYIYLLINLSKINDIFYELTLLTLIIMTNCQPNAKAHLHPQLYAHNIQALIYCKCNVEFGIGCSAARFK